MGKILPNWELNVICTSYPVESDQHTYRHGAAEVLQAIKKSDLPDSASNGVIQLLTGKKLTDNKILGVAYME